MNLCSNIMPVLNPNCNKLDVNNFIQDIKIIDCENTAEIRWYLDIVKDDPFLSITIEPIFDKEAGFIGKFTHWCHINCKFYKPKSFQITLG